MEVTFEDIVPGYWVKYNPFRKDKLYTASGPEGRLGDVDTRDEAIELIWQEISK